MSFFSLVTFITTLECDRRLSYTFPKFQSLIFLKCTFLNAGFRCTEDNTCLAKIFSGQNDEKFIFVKCPQKEKNSKSMIVVDKVR